MPFCFAFLADTVHPTSHFPLRLEFLEFWLLIDCSPWLRIISTPSQAQIFTQNSDSVMSDFVFPSVPNSFFSLKLCDTGRSSVFPEPLHCVPCMLLCNSWNSTLNSLDSSIWNNSFLAPRVRPSGEQTEARGRLCLLLFKPAPSFPFEYLRILLPQALSFLEFCNLQTPFLVGLLEKSSLHLYYP